MSEDKLLDSCDQETAAAETLRLVREYMEQPGTVSDEDDPAETLRLIRQELENAEASEVEASSSADVELHEYSDSIFRTIQSTLQQAIKRMGGREIILDAGVSDDHQALAVDREIVHISAGALITLVTAAEIEFYRGELGSVLHREAFRRSTIEHLAAELDEVNLDYSALVKEPLWRKIFANIAKDAHDGKHTAEDLSTGLDACVRNSESTFSAEVSDDDHEQFANIVCATLLRIDRIKTDNAALGVDQGFRLSTTNPNLADPVSPYERPEIVALRSGVIEILGDQKFDILYPAGNVTCLMEVTPEQLKHDRSILVAKATTLVNAGLVEQVGFYYVPEGQSKLRDVVLEMSGGEFCLNATLSLAAHIHKRTIPVLENDISVLCSGNDVPISCDCSFADDNSLAVRAIYAVESTPDTVEEDITLVCLPGIAHFLQKIPAGQKFMIDKEAQLRRLMAAYADKIADQPAIGLIQYQKDDHGLQIDPMVHVKETDTCVNETACGSGSVALTILLRHQAEERGDMEACKWAIAQPSGRSVNTKFKVKGDFKTPAVIINSTVLPVCSSSDRIED